ncbi:MAG: (d)CMP kinase [Nanoarchaeota archaeon]
MIITITGLPGSGKTSVAKELAKHLHLKHYSMGDIFRSIAKKKKISVLDLTKQEKLVNYLDEEQKRIAKKNKNCIIDSRLGAYLIKNAHIRIYLYAPLKARVNRIARRDKISYKKALHETLAREREELKHYKHEYGIDYRNKKLYNIILNTKGLTVEEATKKLIKKIKQLK